jgi:hypothetical protein
MPLEEQQLEAGIAALEAQRGLRSSRLVPDPEQLFEARRDICEGGQPHRSSRDSAPSDGEDFEDVVAGYRGRGDGERALSANVRVGRARRPRPLLGECLTSRRVARSRVVTSAPDSVINAAVRG